MNEYLLRVWIPETGYAETTMWTGENVDIVKECSRWAERFAIKYGWDNELFETTNDCAIPKSEKEKNLFESKVNEYNKNIKYSLYSCIVTNSPLKGIDELSEEEYNVAIPKVVTYDENEV